VALADAERAEAGLGQAGVKRVQLRRSDLVDGTLPKWGLMLALVADRYRVSVDAARPWLSMWVIQRSSNSLTVCRPVWRWDPRSTSATSSAATR
jgi:hypothetical protein